MQEAENARIEELMQRVKRLQQENEEMRRGQVRTEEEEIADDDWNSQLGDEDYSQTQQPDHRSEHTTDPTYRGRGHNGHQQAYHPFTDDIMRTHIPDIFKALNIDRYDGSPDPKDHLTTFTTQIFLTIDADPVMCKVFPTTLKGATLAWYSELLAQSIDNFEIFA